MARFLLSLLVAALALSNTVPVTTAVSCDVKPDPPTPTSTATVTAAAPATTERVQANVHAHDATPSMTPSMTPQTTAAAAAAPTPAPSPTPMTPTATSSARSASPSPVPSPSTSAPVVISRGTMGLGTCYEPMHSQDYPLNGGDSSRVGAVLDRDLAQLRNHFAVLRTYHSQYFGLNIAEYASKFGLKLFVGLATYPGRSDWDEIELQAAVAGARDHPGTVEAIVVGSEDLVAAGGSKSVDAILAKVETVRARLQAAGVPAGSVLVGTAQRINELVNPAIAGDMDRLVAGCDFVGVNIYPFFTTGFDPRNPVALLDAQWAQLRSRYGSLIAKMRVTETGWPSAGSAPSGFPGNVPSAETQRAYFHAVADWKPRDMAGAHFWFMAYDRRSDDAMSATSYERFFGVFTATNDDKGVL